MTKKKKLKQKPNKDLLFYILPLLIIALIIFLDQLTKYLFQYKNFIIIKGLLEIKYSQNTGIVFGWFANNLFIVVVLPILIIIFLIYTYLKEAKKHKLLMLGLPFMAAGLLGNIIDRFARGFVTDFILVPIRPEQNISNFNIADVFLISGVVLVVVYLMWYEKIKKK